MPWIISRQKKNQSPIKLRIYICLRLLLSRRFTANDSLLSLTVFLIEMHYICSSVWRDFVFHLDHNLSCLIRASVCKKMKRTINQQLQKILNRDYWEWFANSNTNVKTISRCKIIVNWYLHPTVSRRSLRGLERKERFTGNKTPKKTIISLFAVFLPFDFDKFCCKHSLNPSWYVQYRPADQTHTRSWPIRKK